MVELVKEERFLLDKNLIIWPNLRVVVTQNTFEQKGRIPARWNIGYTAVAFCRIAVLAI